MIDTIVIYTKAELKIAIVISSWEKTAVFGPRGLPLANYVNKQIYEKYGLRPTKAKSDCHLQHSTHKLDCRDAFFV